ncbi:MAG: DUF481 domain-containing protein [Thermodesulfobacteriota bacterium]
MRVMIWIIVLLLAPLSLAGELMARAKVDTVVLANGDSLTCEIKELANGRLQLSTNYTRSSFNLDWREVKRLVSPAHFEIDLEDGSTIYGQLADSGLDQMIRVEHDGSHRLVERSQVVAIVPISPAFKDRVKLNLGAGYVAYKAQNQRNFNLSADGRYRDRKRLLTVSGSWINMEQDEVSNDDQAETSLRVFNRAEAGLSAIRFVGPRWGVLAIVDFLQSDELDLDYRLTSGVGVSRILVKSNRNYFRTSGGLAYTNESYGTESSGDRNNMEAFWGLTLGRFVFREPETEISSRLVIFPSITNSGRWRSELNVKLRYELFHDFFLQLTVFDSYDSDPPSIEEVNHDWGLVSSLTYSII